MQKSETISHSPDNGDDILISWDVKYIFEDEREREQKWRKSTMRREGERHRARRDRVTVLRVSRIRVL